MNRKLYVISKTHLDLGYTDFAYVIKQNYINEFIPNAIKLAKQINTKHDKNFVWTTGAWILNEALNLGTPEQQILLTEAIANGDVVSHGMPFTTHTELLDRDTLDFGLSLCDKIDAIRGKKTISAKLTDVPGHSKGLVEALANKGIKLLHIGVNGATPLPTLPACFVWKNGDSEIIVIYSSDYGGAYKCKITGNILYFDHTMDNKGVPCKEKVLEKLDSLKAEYPDHTIVASSMDEFAAELWEKRGQLPYYSGEIGDTWIHGASADPYKAGALKELMFLKQKWVAEGSLHKDSLEYNNFSNEILCLAEHTCGMDSKKFLGDYEHYLKKDFQLARKKDRVIVTKPWREFPQNYSILLSRIKGKFQKCSYRAIEKSWAEKREHITKAVNYLSEPLKSEASVALSNLIPAEKITHFDKPHTYGGSITVGDWSFSINEYGGIANLSRNKEEIIAKNNNPTIEYKSYSIADYNEFFDKFIRDFKHTYKWSLSAFGKPLLKYVSRKYPTGIFPYRLKQASIKESSKKIVVLVDLVCDEKAYKLLGAPKLMQIEYCLTNDGLQIKVNWLEKDANRLPEAINFALFPTKCSINLQKIDTKIDIEDIASMGNRNIHAVEKINLNTANNSFYIINRHAPLVSLNRGKILEFNNEICKPDETGIAYILQNNVWGTNFRLWYENNASFTFLITSN